MHNPIDKLRFRAGLTALARYSMIAEPRQDVYALGQNEWNHISKKRDIVVLDQPDPEAIEVEIWAYQPDLLANYGRGGTVDPLSLYLCLRENSDERVEQALEELLGETQW